MQRKRYRLIFAGLVVLAIALLTIFLADGIPQVLSCAVFLFVIGYANIWSVMAALERGAFDDGSFRPVARSGAPIKFWLTLMVLGAMGLAAGVGSLAIFGVTLWSAFKSG